MQNIGSLEQVLYSWVGQIEARGQLDAHQRNFARPL
jgi:hypothetical protein